MSLSSHHDPDDFADLGSKHKMPRIRAADPDLAVSPLQGRWWSVTKRMIEEGSRRFWERRGMAHDPGQDTFRERTRAEVVQAEAARQEVAK